MISSRHRNALLLTLVVVGGGLLRFGAVGYGLPRHDLGQDEMITATRVRDSVLAGRPGWPRFHWPNLNVYISSAAVSAARWVEERLGLEARDDFLIGRVLTAVLGTLTLVALYFAAARLFDRPTGITAAALMAVIPLHAFRSRLWVPDVPMTFFYTLALLAAVWVLARPTYGRFVACGVAVGLATAAKYNGAGAFLLLVVAAGLALPVLRDRWRHPAMLCRLALAGAVSVAVFFAVDPFALARLDEVLNGVGFVSSRYIDAPASGFLGWHIWSYVAGSFFASGPEGVGPVISILAVAGWALLLARRSRSATLVWLPALLYLLIFSSILHDPFERMFLPLVPHIAMLAAVGLIAGARRVAGWRRWPWPAPSVAGVVVLAVLLVAAAPAARHAVAARHDETRIQAADWLDIHVPAGAFVFREWDMVWPGSRHFNFNRRLHDLWEGRWTPRLVSQRMDFVVTTSTNFERVRRQRGRPFFARRAAYYDQVFGSPLFELAARFEPDLHTFGPEVRIYRSRAPRGLVLGPARSQVDLLRQMPWVNIERLRTDGLSEGLLRLRAAGELAAGRVTVSPAGWYVLEVRAASPTAAALEVGLGKTRRSFRVEGEQVVTVRALLRQGKNWWRLGSDRELAPSDELLVSSARLTRLSWPEAEPAASQADRASAEPAAPKIVDGGWR